MTHRELTQNELIWKMLEEAGAAGCTTADVAGRATEEGIYINRYSARIMELDPDKTLIHREKIPGSSQWRYTLTKYLLLSEGAIATGGRADGHHSPTQGDSLSAVEEPHAPSERSNTTSLFDLAPVSGTKSAVSAVTGKLCE